MRKFGELLTLKDNYTEHEPKRESELGDVKLAPPRNPL